MGLSRFEGILNHLQIYSVGLIRASSKRFIQLQVYLKGFKQARKTKPHSTLYCTLSSLSQTVVRASSKEFKQVRRTEPISTLS